MPAPPPESEPAIARQAGISRVWATPLSLVRGHGDARPVP
jgi:hypothetical protein